MNNNALKKETLECKICLIPFSDTIEHNIPRLLSCGHTICHSCADTLRKASLDKFTIICPFDRQITANFYGRVENLRRNFAIIDLVQERNEEAKLAERMEAVEICEDPIVPCYENAKHESTKYCKTCEVDFCDSCFHSVHSSKILSTHQSVPISEKPIRLPKCPNHPNSIADHFCDDVNCEAPTSLCCKTCRQDLHKDHAVILTEVKAEENERELTNLLETLNSFEIKMGENLEKTKDCIESVENDDAECRSMMTAIEEYFEREKMKALQKLLDYMDAKVVHMENKEAIENSLELIKKTKKETEKLLKRKELLFVRVITNLGELDSSLDRVRKADLVPMTMPTFEEIINPKSGSLTPPAPPNNPPAPQTKSLRDLFSFSKLGFF